MIIRHANERGSANFGWLNSRHTFSFGHYFDPKHMGFGPLRVINEDKVKASAGFPPHGHADMEIISYVVDGALEHKDSDGNSSVIRPGEVQKMSAGRGIRHSEYNASNEEDVHFLQIWIEPDKRGIPSSYQQKSFEELNNVSNDLTLLMSPDGQEGSISIQQQAWMYGAKVGAESDIEHTLGDDRIAWLHVVKGSLLVNGEELRAGDGASFAAGEAIHMTSGNNAEILLFDMVQH